MARSTGRTTPTLLIIGGAEDRVGKATVLRRFVRLSGGRRSRIVLIPTASSFEEEVVTAYTEVFTGLTRTTTRPWPSSTRRPGSS
jgi:cyanophycinase